MGQKSISVPKINVVPILDAVFIFIFFLLMNTRFADYFQITASKPLLKSINSTETPPDDKGMHFKLRLTSDQIQVTTGVREQVLKSFSWTDEDLQQLEQFLMGLKQQHPKENSIVVKSVKSILYQDVIRVADLVQKPVTWDLQAVRPSALFQRMAFESMK